MFNFFVTGKFILLCITVFLEINNGAELRAVHKNISSVTLLAHICVANFRFNPHAV